MWTLSANKKSPSVPQKSYTHNKITKTPMQSKQPAQLYYYSPSQRLASKAQTSPYGLCPQVT